MAHQVVWSPSALADVEAIASYISRDSTSYASAVVRRIINATRGLAKYPLAGRTVPEFDDKTIREVFVHNYRIVYQLGTETVTVAAVIHGKRQFTSSFQSEAPE